MLKAKREGLKISHLLFTLIYFENAEYVDLFQSRTLMRTQISFVLMLLLLHTIRIAQCALSHPPFVLMLLILHTLYRLAQLVRQAGFNIMLRELLIILTHQYELY